MSDFITIAFGLGLFVLAVWYVVHCPTRSTGPRNSKHAKFQTGVTAMTPNG
jgi:hypothetical protein